jgi:hypothetical protein
MPTPITHFCYCFGAMALQEEYRDFAPTAAAEFAALRATIRERGTARILLFFAVMAVWGALAVATAAAIALPVAALLPLVVLAAGFEATTALHVGVERIGRYLQVRFEEAAGRPMWETAAMQFGARGRAIGSDALFSTVYVLATFLNFLPVALTALVPEVVALGAMHAIFLWRVVTVRRAAAGQREAELRAFREILAAAERVEGAEGAETAEPQRRGDAQRSF